jgi:hypothetical protein
MLSEDRVTGVTLLHFKLKKLVECGTSKTYMERKASQSTQQMKRDFQFHSAFLKTK